MNPPRIDITDIIDGFFADPSSLSSGSAPRFVLIQGCPSSGKTYLRRQQYTNGFVVLDAADIFLKFPDAPDLPFPGPYAEPLEVIGVLVAKRAIQERRNIVTEMIGTVEDSDPILINALMHGMKNLGYPVDVAFVHADLDVCLERNNNRGKEEISSYYTERFHRKWLLDAIAENQALAGSVDPPEVKRPRARKRAKPAARARR